MSTPQRQPTGPGDDPGPVMPTRAAPPDGASRTAYGLLAPAALIFSLRAILALAGTQPETVPGLGIATGIAGALSLLGILLLVWSTRRRAEAATVQVAATLVVIGHFVVSDVMAGDMGPAMVYLGTGIAAAAWYRPAGWMGALAASGVLLRDGTPIVGLTGVAVGSGLTGAVLLVLALLPQLVYKNRYMGCTDDAH